jgi:hypothetical protein
MEHKFLHKLINELCILVRQVITLRMSIWWAVSDRSFWNSAWKAWLWSLSPVPLFKSLLNNTNMASVVNHLWKRSVTENACYRKLTRQKITWRTSDTFRSDYGWWIIVFDRWNWYESCVWDCGLVSNGPTTTVGGGGDNPFGHLPQNFDVKNHSTTGRALNLCSVLCLAPLRCVSWVTPRGCNILGISNRAVSYLRAINCI